MDKGAALNRRIWTLFEKAGFKTEPNSGSATEHVVELASKKHRRVDLFASALGVSIVGSNKSGGVKDSWSAHVNDWDEIRRCAKADTALFVVTDKELSVDDKRYVKDKGLCLWTEDDVSY